VIFYPGINENTCLYGAIRGVKWFYPDEYKTDCKEDYALLIFDQDIGEYTVYFGLRPNYRDDLIGMEFNLDVYHWDMMCKDPKHHYLWGTK